MISVETIDEISEVIYRRKFDKYLTDEERAEFLQSLLAEAILVEVLDTAQVCRDPKDDKFLNLASDGDADYIVTGDKDLLVMKTYGDVRILSAQDFLSLFA